MHLLYYNVNGHFHHVKVKCITPDCFTGKINEKKKKTKLRRFIVYINNMKSSVRALNLIEN